MRFAVVLLTLVMGCAKGSAIEQDASSDDRGDIDASAFDAPPTGIDAAAGSDAPPAILDATPDGPPAIQDAAPDAPPALVACNPLTQTPCGASEKCGWIDEPTGSRSVCVPNGAAAANTACTAGPVGATGYSNCARGTECVNGTCRAICGSAGAAPTCPTQYACNRYNGLFDEPAQPAGVCDPGCEPLTQRRLTDSAEACGSPLAASPNRGCYTFDLKAFSCAGVPAGAGTLTDRMPAQSTAGVPFVNGCAPGFIPFLYQSTGSTTVICAGTCAPKKTDTALAANLLGDTAALAKLNDQATPLAGNGTCAIGKKGSVTPQNCVYLWWFNTDAAGNFVQSPYNDTLGLCLAYQQYSYDHDANTATPNRTYPGCQNLPPKGATPATDGNAHQWGCYNSVEANARAARPDAIRTDLRALTGGMAVRHELR